MVECFAESSKSEVMSKVTKEPVVPVTGTGRRLPLIKADHCYVPRWYGVYQQHFLISQCYYNPANKVKIYNSVSFF